MTNRKFIQHALAAGLAFTAMGLGNSSVLAKENVFEAVPDGIDAYVYGYWRSSTLPLCPPRASLTGMDDRFNCRQIKLASHTSMEAASQFAPLAVAPGQSSRDALRQ